MPKTKIDGYASYRLDSNRHSTRKAAKSHLQIPLSKTKLGMRTLVYQASTLE